MTPTYDRAAVIDENFIHALTHSIFPLATSLTSFKQAQISSAKAKELAHSIFLVRHLDLIARRLKTQNKGYYSIASAGHEATVGLAAHLITEDMAFLHYRSAGFMIQREKEIKGSIDIHAHCQSLVASCDEPVSGGRHKVFGSLELNVPPQTSTIASHCPKAVGAAFGLARKHQVSDQTRVHPLIVCSFGDASFNHASAQTAFNTASWLIAQKHPLPLLFVCEDNGLGISVPTPSDWIEMSATSLNSIKYVSANGLNVADVFMQSQLAIEHIRHTQQPVFLHIKTVRLLGHAGNDFEWQYQDWQTIEANEANDPLLHMAKQLIDESIMSAAEILQLYESVRLIVVHAAEQASKEHPLQSAESVAAGVQPSNIRQYAEHQVSDAERQQVFADQYTVLQQPRSMSQLINYTLTDLMLQYQDIAVFGEDVGKKGGVYHVTADLQKRFSGRRVFDSLLDETTILGTAIGMSLQGWLPIPEIQFLAYLHNAEDQLRGEAATLPFLSNGQFSNPMVVRIASFAYQKGFGGHFHNDNSIAVLRDIPGIIVATASRGDIAAQVLRECVRLAATEGRVVIFLEPIALYAQKDLHAPGDGQWLSVYPQPDVTLSFGQFTLWGDPSEITIITYANGTYLSLQAQELLRQEHGVQVNILDLHWLAPLDMESICVQIQHTKAVLIVDECRQSGSLSEALITGIVEHLPNPLKIKRITGVDTFLPLGPALQTVLPSRGDIVNAVCSLV